MKPVNYEKLTFKERREIREHYISYQNYNCCHCGNNIYGQPSEEILKLKVNKSLFPVNFFKWPVHLHHCHKTGMTIGAVHNHCNAVLWQYYGE